MHFSTRNVGVIASLVLSGAMIGVAFWLSGPPTSQVSAESAEELLRAYAAKDTDNDGLADWQEAVYGTDPADPESAQSGVTDAEAVQKGLVAPQFAADTSALDEIPTSSATEPAPEDTTLTAQFSRDFFTDYLSGRSATPPTSEDIVAFVQDAVAELAASSGARFSANDLSISGSGEDALRKYAADAEDAFSALGVNTQVGELELFADAVYQNDNEALTLVGRIGKAYEAGARAFVGISVPAETVTAHLRTANALAHLGAVVGDMATIRTDPLRGFVGLSAYQNAVQELGAGIKEIGTTFMGVTIAPEDEGGMFYQLTQLSVPE